MKQSLGSFTLFFYHNICLLHQFIQVTLIFSFSRSYNTLFFFFFCWNADLILFMCVDYSKKIDFLFNLIILTWRKRAIWMQLQWWWMQPREILWKSTMLITQSLSFFVICYSLFFCVALRNIFIKLDLKFIQILRWCLFFWVD